MPAVKTPPIRVFLNIPDELLLNPHQIGTNLDAEIASKMGYAPDVFVVRVGRHTVVAQTCFTGWQDRMYAGIAAFLEDAITELHARLKEQELQTAEAATA